MTKEPGSGEGSGSHVVRTRLLTADDVDEAGQLLAAAFDEEPQSMVFLPDPTHRRELSLVTARREVRSRLRYATAFGADLDGRLAGVALWNPPNVHPSPLSGRLRWALELLAVRAAVMPALPPAARALWRERRPLSRTLWVRQRHVRTVGAQPCWYLAVLGTAPDARGRGVARALLDHVLERCDVDGLPAWLETTEAANTHIYERFGFHSTVRIPGGGGLPDFWMMRRNPTSTTSVPAPEPFGPSPD